MDTTAANWTYANRRRLLASIVPAICLFASAGAQQTRQGRDRFTGRWDLVVHDPAGDYPSWIAVDTTEHDVSVTFVGKIGHARHLASASLDHGILRFTVPPDGLADGTQQYRAALRGRQLIGELLQAGHPKISWSGRHAPTLVSSVLPAWGPPQPVFDGRTLDGWHVSSTGGKNWSIQNGQLTTSGRGTDLISDATYGDFQLHLEWRCSPGANSGVYLRGRYEVQIETDSEAEPASHHTGGVYGFLAPNPEQPRMPNTWQAFDLTLVGRTVTVVQNGIVVIDRQTIAGITGGALDSDEAKSGPIVLQGGETGVTEFRNLVVRRAADQQE